MNTISKNMNKRLNQSRRFYATRSERPVKIKNNPHNYTLLEELDVVWSGMARDLERFLKNMEYDKVEIILKGRVRGLRVGTQLHTHPELIVRMKQLGITPVFDTYPGSLTSIELCENVRTNVIEYNLTVNVNMEEHYLLIEFFKLTKTLNYTIHYDWKGPRSLLLNDMLELEGVSKNDLMKWCLLYHNGYIEPLLSTGYIPSIETLTTYWYYGRTIISVLNCPQLTDEYKVEYLTHILNDDRYNDLQLYYHPTSIKYMKNCSSIKAMNFINNGIVPGLREYNDTIYQTLHHYDIRNIESIGMIDKIIRKECEEKALIILKNSSNEVKDKLYSSMVEKDINLMKCTDPELKEYWSRVPTNNENFLQFLDYRRSQGDEGVELPPAIGEDYSLTRLSKSENIDKEVGRLLDESENESVILLIVQLMRRRVINLRPYLESGFKIVDQLIPYQSILTSKNSRTAEKYN